MRPRFSPTRRPARELVLRTSAEAHPALRVEGDSSVATVLIGTREPRRVGFLVFASGTGSETPVDLDKLRLRSTVGVEWAGPKQPGPDVDGLTVESRRYVVTLDSAGPPGERTAQVELLDGENGLDRHVVTWEVASAITASPKMVVFQSGQKSFRVLLRAGDETPFRVERVECQSPGIKGRAASPGAAVVQVVEIEGTPRPGQGRGVVTVFTNHPAQPRVDLPYVVLE
jgi:hypothetical protein